MSGEMSVRFEGLAPYLYYEDVGEALDWLCRVFGFTEIVRYVDPEGEAFAAEIGAGNATIQLADAGPGYWASKGVNGPIGQLTVIYVNDVDAHHERVSRAGVAAPAPVDQPYGARVYTMADPGGNSWCFWQQLRNEVALPPGWREMRA